MRVAIAKDVSRRHHPASALKRGSTDNYNRCEQFNGQTHVAAEGRQLPHNSSFQLQQTLHAVSGNGRADTVDIQISVVREYSIAHPALTPDTAQPIIPLGFGHVHSHPCFSPVSTPLPAAGRLSRTGPGAMCSCRSRAERCAEECTGERQNQPNAANRLEARPTSTGATTEVTIQTVPVSRPVHSIRNVPP
jgi:hypothetical protein